jgi:hypothetical protein
MISFRFLGVLVMVAFLTVGCAKVTPPAGVEFSQDQYINLLKSFDRAEKGITSFASKGLMEINHIKGSQELKFYAVGTPDPFRIRLELLATQGIPITTLLIKDHHWLIINYREKIAYVGDASCGQLTEIIGICPTRSELYSILSAELVLWDYTIVDVDERKAEVNVRFDNDRIVSICFDKHSSQFKALRDMEKDVLVEFYKNRVNDDTFEDIVKINSGVLNPTVTLRFMEVIKNTKVDSDLFDEQVPNNFKVNNFKD